MTTGNEPKSLDEDTLQPPETRVGSAGSVLGRIQEMKDADRDIRSERRAKIQGLIDGNRPLSQRKLDATGQGDRTNFNDRSGEGMADAAKTPYFSLIFRVPRFCNITTYYGDQPQRRREWGEIMSQEWDCMLRDWRGHNYNTQLRDWQMCVFGVGIVMWPDARDWRWESRKISDVLVPDETEADIDKVDELVALRWKSPVELYRMIENEDAAKTTGWFPSKVKKAIVANSTDSIRQRWGPTFSEEYQASLRRGDVMWNGKRMRIPIADYLVKEFDGKITHVIMLDDGRISDASGLLEDKDDDGMLFKKVGRYDDFTQVICPFFFDIGTGEWHSIKGLGPKIFDFCQYANLLNCDMIDGARNGAGIMLQAKSGEAMQETQMIHINGGTVIPAGYTVEQHRFGDNLRGTLEVKRDLQNTLQSNIGQYRQRVSAENQEPTLGQAKLNYQTQSSLNEASVDRHMETLDWQHKETARRAFSLKLKKSDPGGKEALEMRERCMARGVPKEAMAPDMIKIKAVRGIGSGSPVAMEMATQGMMQLLPMADEEGRNWILRLRSAVLVGQTNVDNAFPSIEEADVPDDNSWAASVENSMMHGDGDVPQVTPKQDDVIHFTTHYQAAAGELQGLQQGQGNPMATLTYLHKAGPHMKAHLDKMAGDPTREAQFKSMSEGWMNLAKMTDQLQQQVEESIKAQKPAPPQPDPALVTGMMKVQGELALKGKKQDGDMALKAQKQGQQMKLADLKAAHGTMIKNYEAKQAVANAAPKSTSNGSGEQGINIIMPSGNKRINLIRGQDGQLSGADVHEIPV